VYCDHHLFIIHFVVVADDDGDVVPDAAFLSLSSFVLVGVLYFGQISLCVFFFFASVILLCFVTHLEGSFARPVRTGSPVQKG
jgi:hypothetical protein